MEHIAAPYLRIPEHLLDLLQKKETVPYFFNGTIVHQDNIGIKDFVDIALLTSESA
jgi:hypothetical protein